VRLMVVSHTPHYGTVDAPVGWGSTVRELDHLASLFDEVVHIAPLHQEAAPPTALPYEAVNLILRPVKPSGGRRLIDKVGIFRVAPAYRRIVRAEASRSDVIHVRAPANISLIALHSLRNMPSRPPMWIKYAGDWRRGQDEPLSYRLQRQMLRSPTDRTVVTINGKPDATEPHIRTFANPSLTSTEIDAGRRAAEEKALSDDLRILFVGRLDDAKGAPRMIALGRELRDRGVPFYMDLVGDGPERADYEYAVRDASLADHIAFHGWVSRTELASFYSRAHLLVLPSLSEGWPKVLSEAMAYGAVPIASSISAIPDILAETGAGIALPPRDVAGFADAVEALERDRERWLEMSAAGLRAVWRFSFEAYVNAVEEMLRVDLGVAVRGRPARKDPVR
jgi:glycosyltransferase involved in cell wall biosynthesis